MYWAWWYTPAIQVSGQLRQAGLGYVVESEASLDCMERLCVAEYWWLTPPNPSYWEAKIS